jgi:hypothetical protein
LPTVAVRAISVDPTSVETYVASGVQTVEVLPGEGRSTFVIGP